MWTGTPSNRKLPDASVTATGTSTPASRPVRVTTAPEWSVPWTKLAADPLERTSWPAMVPVETGSAAGGAVTVAPSITATPDRVWLS